MLSSSGRASLLARGPFFCFTCRSQGECGFRVGRKDSSGVLFENSPIGSPVLDVMLASYNLHLWASGHTWSFHKKSTDFKGHPCPIDLKRGQVDQRPRSRSRKRVVLVDDGSAPCHGHGRRG